MAVVVPPCVATRHEAVRRRMVDRNSKPKIIKIKEIEEVANQIRIKYAPNAAGGEGAGRRTKRAPNARQAPAWAEGRVAPA